jgi:3-oxoacyl-[acyl-carrier protein] reductase
MNSKLKNKVAVVTGASKGIGAAIAKMLAHEGAAVVVNYASSSADANEVVAAIVSAGGKAIAVCGDVSKATDANKIMAVAIAEYGRIDILVNNAGVYQFAALDAITEEQFHRTFNINVLGLLLVTQAAAQHMGAGGSIINIGATITTMKPPGSSVYAASKSAVETITGVLAKELGGRNIRVNAINPGPTQTEGSANMAAASMSKTLTAKTPPEGSTNIAADGMSKTLTAKTPLGRLGMPDDIAKIAVFLASEDSAWMTGDILVASGGLR